MRPTRRTQPYRKGGLRPRGQALQAMLRGRPMYGANPQSPHRIAAKRARRRRRGRKKRNTRRA